MKRELKIETIFIKNPWKWNKPITYLSWIIRQVIAKYNVLPFVPNHAALRITKPDGEVWISDFQSRYKYRKEKYWLLEDTNRITATYSCESSLTDEEILEQIENASSIYKGYEHKKLINYWTKLESDVTIFKENPLRFVCFEWIGFLQGKGNVNFCLPKDLIIKQS